jgi:hypothetical protein
MTCEKEADPAALDRWHDGWFDGYRGNPEDSTDLDYLLGYKEGQTQRVVIVNAPARPEGYYHSPIGTFD